MLHRIFNHKPCCRTYISKTNI